MFALPHLSWKNGTEEDAPHESSFLKLDCSRLKETFGWKPVWDIERALEMTAHFTGIWLTGGNVEQEMEDEISAFEKDQLLGKKLIEEFNV